MPLLPCRLPCIIQHKLIQYRNREAPRIYPKIRLLKLVHKGSEEQGERNKSIKQNKHKIFITLSIISLSEKDDILYTLYTSTMCRWWYINAQGRKGGINKEMSIIQKALKYSYIFETRNCVSWKVFHQGYEWVELNLKGKFLVIMDFVKAQVGRHNFQKTWFWLANLYKISVDGFDGSG